MNLTKILRIKGMNAKAFRAHKPLAFSILAIATAVAQPVWSAAPVYTSAGMITALEAGGEAGTLKEQIYDVSVDTLSHIETGSFGASVNDPGWNLRDQTGVRQYRRHIQFNRSFQNPPVVTVSISGFDIENGYNARLTVGAESVDQNGFDVIFNSWADTKIWLVNVTWLAIGS